MSGNFPNAVLSDIQIDRLSQVYSSSEPFHARSVINDIPHPTSTVIADLAYEEYCRRLQRGELVELGAFLDGFPEVASELRATIEVARLIQDQCPSIASVQTGSWPSPGSSFAGFRLLREIGRGATSRVFEAEEIRLGDRPVAIKVCRRFGGHEEALLGKLSHKHIVPVLSARTAQDFDVLCMPHLSHCTLQHVIGHVGRQSGTSRTAGSILDAVRSRNAQAVHPFPDLPSDSWPVGGRFADLVVAISCQIAGGLSFAHSAGVIHGDIKPSNVLLTNHATALLFDFNLAVEKFAGSSFPGGTLPYMAPEQLRAIRGRDHDDVVDETTDMFSFGVTLYELFTGELPFGRRDRKDSDITAAQALLTRQRRGPDLSSVRQAGASEQTTRLIEKCLQFERCNRHSSAAELERALRAQSSPVRRLSRRAFQNPRRIAAASLGVALGLAGVSGLWRRESSSPPHWLQRGLTAYRRGDLATATHCFHKLDEHIPKSSRARLLLAACYAQSADYGPAHFIAKHIADQSGDGVAWALRGFCYLALTNEHRGAAGYFARADTLGIRSAELLNNWAYCELNLGQFKKVKALLDEALSINPSLPSALLNRAVLELQVSLTQSRVPLMDDVERLEAAYRDNPHLHVLAARMLAVRALHGVCPIEEAQARLERAAACGASPQEIADARAVSAMLKNPRTPAAGRADGPSLERVVFPFPEWPKPLLAAGERDPVELLSELNGPAIVGPRLPVVQTLTRPPIESERNSQRHD